MDIILAVLLYGLMAASVAIPALRTRIARVFRITSAALRLAGLVAYDAAAVFVFYLGVAILAETILITLATAATSFFGYKLILIGAYGLNVLLFVVLMYAAYLLYQPVAAATARLRQLGKELSRVSWIFLPIPLLGEAIQALAALISGTAETMLRGLARTMAGVAMYFLTLTALAWVDLEWGSNILNPFTLTIGWLIALTLAIMSVSKHTSADGHRNVAVTLGGVVTIVSLLAVLAHHYRSLVDQMAWWEWISVRGFYPPLALSLILTIPIVASMANIVKTWRHHNEKNHDAFWTSGRLFVSRIVMLTTVWFLIWPWMTKGEPPYLWTQRLIHFQFGRLHAVNTTQAKAETEGVVAGAELAGKLPRDLDVLNASFYPSADRAHTLADKEQAWEDRASGRAANRPVQAVPGYLNAWKDGFVQHEPTLVTFGRELICSSSDHPGECTDATGSDKADKRYKTVLQDDSPDTGGTKDGAAGRFRAVIARVRGDGGDYTLPIETGFAIVICKPGTTQLRTNVWTWYGPVKTSQNTYGNSGEISFQKYVGDPLAIVTCKSQPDQAIIPIDPALVRDR